MQLVDRQSLGSSVLITGSTSLSIPLAEQYYISVSSAQTVNLPAITATSVGIRVIFRRAQATASSTVITFAVTGGTQLIYNLSNTGSNSQALLASGVFRVELCSGFLTVNTYAWYVV